MIEMPKCFFFFLGFQIFIYNIYAQDSEKFTLDGKVNGRSKGKLYLLYSTKNKTVIDSTEIRNGRFIFHGSIDEPTTAELTDNLKMRKGGYGNYLSDLYLEPGTIKLSVANSHFAEWKASGSEINQVYRQFTHYIDPLFERIFGLQNQSKSDSLMTTMLSDSLTFYNNQLKKYLLSFIVSNPDSYIGILATQRLLWLDVLNADSVLSMFNLLTPRIKNTKAAKKLKESIVNIISSSIGKDAPDFNRKDLNGNLVRLSSFKGQYVLLDFWASWCVPCRAQTPHIKTLYEKYSNRGLKVIAISCDSKYDAWQNAILKDNTESFVNILSFTESDMDFLKSNNNVGAASWKGELRKQFNLMPIPVYILIDPKGVIIGRYGANEKASADMLDKKLAEIFDKG